MVQVNWAIIVRTNYICGAIKNENIVSRMLTILFTNHPKKAFLAFGILVFAKNPFLMSNTMVCNSATTPVMKLIALWNEFKIFIFCKVNDRQFAPFYFKSLNFNSVKKSLSFKAGFLYKSDLKNCSLVCHFCRVNAKKVTRGAQHKFSSKAFAPASGKNSEHS